MFFERRDFVLAGTQVSAGTLLMVQLRMISDPLEQVSSHLRKRMLDGGENGQERR